jgi:hypothetical protein
MDKRKLGDEWIAWNGEFISPEEVRAGGRLFLILLTASVFVTIAVAGLILYLVTPRLAQLDVRLPAILAALLTFASLVVVGWLLAIILISKSRFRVWRLPLIHRLFYEFSSLADRLGRKLGLSRDKVGHSFIKLSNALTIGKLTLKPQLKILILLPRCLTREARDRIMSTCAEYNVVVKIATGGEIARKYIREISPDAVIGVACERDLVSGIQDTAQHIPVIGIPNIRPDGPCQSTHIEFEELETTLRRIFGAGPSIESQETPSPV